MNDTRKLASRSGGPSRRPQRSGTPALRPEAKLLGERLHAARLAAHLTQQELAGERFSKSYISAVERGKLFPSFSALGILAERLRVPISYLLGERKVYEGSLEESKRIPFVDPDSQVPDEEARRRLGIAETLIRQDRPAEAWEQLGGRESPPDGWPLLLRPHWAWLAGWTLFLLERPADGVRCLDQGLRLARPLHLRAPHSRQAYWEEMIEWLHCFLGVTHCAQGQTTLALQDYQRGLEAIEHGRVGNAELKLWIYKGLGKEYFALARYKESILYYQKALAEVKNSNNKRQHGLSAWGLARAYQQQGDPFRAKYYYQESLQALGEHGYLPLLAPIRALYGLALIGLGDLEEAEHQIFLGLEGARHIGDSRTVGMALAYLASLYNARGEPDRAIQAAEDSLPLARESGDGRAQGHALFTLVDSYTARNEWAAAERTYREVIHLAEQLPDYEMLFQARQGYASFLAEQERYREAYQALAPVGVGASG